MMKRRINAIWMLTVLMIASLVLLGSAQAGDLMWASKDNNTNDTSWEAAKVYCQSYREGGYSDWRLPTASELLTLCSSGGYSGRLSYILEWASDTRPSQTWMPGNQNAYVDFHDCRTVWIMENARGGMIRVLPVRNVK